VTTPCATGTLNLGFLTVLHEAGGYLGGYLVTNLWGRPLEFRLSTAVQPNRVQQILYGGTLQSYICADLIGKTLLDRTSASAQLVLTDREPTLDLRLLVNLPVVWAAHRDDAVAAALAAQGAEVAPASDHHGPLLRHPRHPEDASRVRDILCQLEGNLDLAEPFDRIREALAEARKMGVTNRN
jgi:hypothetical protein